MEEPGKLPEWSEPRDIGEAESIVGWLGQNMHEHAYILGRTLMWIKKKVGHGNYTTWVKNNIWFTPRTARNMMAFARRCIKAGTTLEYHPAKGNLVAVLSEKRDSTALLPVPASSNIAETVERTLAALPPAQRNRAITLIAAVLDKYRAAEIVSAPEWLDPELWQSFRNHRKAIRKPLTAHAEKLALKTLSKLRIEGCDPREVIEQSIVSCWSGLFPVKKPPPSPEEKMRQVLTRGL